MPTSESTLTSTIVRIITDPWGGTSRSDTTYNSKYRARNWVRTPGFRTKVKGRKTRSQMASLPMNGYTDYRFSISNGAGVIIYKEPSKPGSVGTLQGCLAVANTPVCDLLDSRFSGLYNRCIAKLPTRMNGSNFNLPLFLAEGHKTVGMFSKAVTDISGILRRTGSSKRELHNMWLEYRYGWRLLAKDIYDALTTLHDIRTRKVKQRVSVTCTETLSASIPSYAMTPSFWSAGTVNVNGLLDLKQELGTTITLYYEDNSSISTLQQLGITNPINLAWELIPYSFVVDWFIPVGDYLSSLDAFLGKSFVSGTVSKWFEEFVRIIL